MGFLCMCLEFSKPLVILVSIISSIKCVASLFFSDINMFESSEGHIFPRELYIPTEGSSSIKSGLAVVAFADFSKRRRPEKDETICAVCLIEFEAGHKVRELGNCFHAFHKGCIDKWVDMGNVTCPLCRAQLLPKGREEMGLTSDR